MHSSRMRTAHLLTISQHALLGGVPAQGVYLPGGVPAQVCTCQGGTCPGGCTCPWGVPARGGGGVLAQVLSIVNRMTDRCKNITLPQTSFAGGKKKLRKTLQILRLFTVALPPQSVTKVSGMNGFCTFAMVNKAMCRCFLRC